MVDHQVGMYSFIPRVKQVERLPDEVKIARTSQFSTLSSTLSSCEDGLYDAAYPSRNKT